VITRRFRRLLDEQATSVPSTEVDGAMLVDPETGRRREVSSASRRLRERYAEAARIQQQTITSAIRRSGAAHLPLRTDGDWIADIVRHVHAQRRLSRAARRPASSPGGS